MQAALHSPWGMQGFSLYDIYSVTHHLITNPIHWGTYAFRAYLLHFFLARNITTCSHTLTNGYFSSELILHQLLKMLLASIAFACAFALCNVRIILY